MLRKFLILLALYGTVHADSTLDWETAVDRVLGHCCIMQIAEDHYDIALALVDQAQAWPNPELTIAYEGYPHEPSRDENEIAVEIEQLIELGGKRSARYQIANSEANVAGWEWESMKIELLNELAHAFISAASIQAKVELAQEQLKITQEIYQTMQTKAESGLATQTQVKRSKLELSTSEIELRKQTKNLYQAYKEIALQWHAEEPDFNNVVYPFYELEPLPPLCDYIAALDDRPDVAQKEWDIEAAYSNWLLEKANAVPDVVLSAGYNGTQNRLENDYAVGISFAIPIFDRNKGNIRAACIAVNTEEREYVELLYHLRASVSSLYTICQNTYEEAIALKELVDKDAKDIYEQIQMVHKEGKIDYLSLLDAEQAFYDVKDKYTDALTEYHLAKSDLDYMLSPHEH